MHALDLYDYSLPRERIAQEPLRNRVDARLMVINRAHGTIEHQHVRDLPELLRAEDSLVLNNSRVVPARLVGYRTRTQGRWQGLYLRSDPTTGVWELLTKTRGSLQAGETITLQDRDARDGGQLEVIGRDQEGHLFVRPVPESVRLDDSLAGVPISPTQWLERFGRVPIPPYIRDGRMVDADLVNYQTVFASEREEDKASVAAPTAGLHFTESLLRNIAKGQTAIHEVTLHVGIGTFRPIEVDDIDTHVMHEEWGRIDAETCANIRGRRAAGGRCVAVGTTSVRVLESCAAANGGALQEWTGSTDLFIKPPYSFAAVDALMTNFHLPKSSLLVLVSAFAGHELIMRAYQEAIDAEYRFFSYGDAMLIL
ncbi:tRNA preQ1(34) S-adenosylmethionine ribosyltransferase-isomerase QueA [Allorhodopirellula heiligendammensis]|uniref:S-adenosylmethionine:tRNA ribosyltransferase-isomerase n=1 Tax=Allorhodopirellula heiligendammensis TaxID=2714739 RepID=A0A5C6C8S0_9BACT|nr:tRNA preQ1(34) S-adenosylmethionine ribosyltransferase-isomerase QueA [Allorhodopirellula heiligendammensis]TWU19754.1 S-adenosylmethionine:tRNA ribosyltransferase-isomerase [Allorhodopirellula heiligendammensis]